MILISWILWIQIRIGVQFKGRQWPQTIGGIPASLRSRQGLVKFSGSFQIKKTLPKFSEQLKTPLVENIGFNFLSGYCSCIGK